MPKLSEDLQKHTLHLRRGDVDKLREIYPDVAVAVVIRRLISTTVDRFERNQPVINIEEMVL